MHKFMIGLGNLTSLICFALSFYAGYQFIISYPDTVALVYALATITSFVIGISCAIGTGLLFVLGSKEQEDRDSL